MLARIISTVLATVFLLSSFYIYDHYGLIFSLFAVLISFVFFFPMGSYLISNFFVALFFPASAGVVKEELSSIHAKVALGEINQAIIEINDYLAKNPQSGTAKSLLARIYYQELKQPNRVLDLFFEELKSKSLSVESEEMIQISIDILLEQNRQEDARRMITQCLHKVNNAMLRKKLKQRLKHIA